MMMKFDYVCPTPDYYFTLLNVCAMAYSNLPIRKDLPNTFHTTSIL